MGGVVSEVQRYANPSFSPVLRELRGDRAVGEGPLEVLLRAADFNITEMTDASGRKQNVPANTLVAFTAQAFRNIGEDHWEFRVAAMTGGGEPTAGLLYVHGTDILTCRLLSKVLG